MGKGTFASFAIGILGYCLLRFFVPLPTAIAVIAAAGMATVIGYPLGMLAGHFMSRGDDVETRGYRLVAWANLVSWLVPVVGMTLSAITWQFSRHADTKRRLYFWLSTIGGSLAIANAGFAGAANAGEHLPMLNAGPSGERR